MASQVYHIGFMDKNNGLASYIDSENEKRYLAASDNGGQTWKARQFDLTLNELYPVKFFSPPRSGKLYMLCSGGEIFATKDNGKHWEPVLSYQSTGANTGAAATGDGFLTRVWSAATRMSHLDFTYIPEDAVVSYEITTGNSVMFDTTDIGKNTKKTITLENTGDVVINFKEIRLVPDPDVDTSEFEFFFPPPSSIEFGRTAKIYIEFNPKEVGIRKAKVEIVPEYDPFDVRTVQLTGFGREALSVDEFARENGITIYNPYPNPAVQDASVRFYLPSPLPVTLELYDAAGNTAGTIFSGYLGEGEHNFPIETGNLSSGNYHIRLNANGTVLHRKLSITK